jgi:hyperosmotically inducible protein
MQRMSRLGMVIVAAGWLVCVSSGLASAGVSDAWITTKTKIALFTAKDISSNTINVDTVDGMVTLHGQVTSADEKAKAEEEAKKIDGVKSVQNLLQVVPSRHEKAVKASDSQLKVRVAKALKNDRSLEDSSIAVESVNDGVVLLGGKADSASDHLRAIQVARAIPGVHHVETEVKSPDALADEELRRDSGSPHAGATRGIAGATKDMWITTDTKTRLFADSRTPALDINVDTWNGVVTLFGSVPSRDAKAAAEADARKVSGVTRVVNELQVVPSAKKEEVQALDDDLKTAVQHALARQEELKGIAVDVKNGVARLTGTVQSQQQRLDAAVAARSTAGIRAVEDDLRISPAAQASAS